jgi:hypothetical protein
VQPKNDSFWDATPSVGLEKFVFTERWTKEGWYRLQRSYGSTRMQSDGSYDCYSTMEHWDNDEYWVMLDKKCQTAVYDTFHGNPLWHLVIRRIDEQPCRDWQMFQAIKNEVVGPEYEAVEIYPAQSRIMDVGNLYHLWILAPKGEETIPRYKIGCRKYGRVSLNDDLPVMLVAERGSREHLEEMWEASNDGRMRLLMFPETLRPEVEKEFPGVEYVDGMMQYIEKHPEHLPELERFEDWV